jgi:hypothetical protein
MEKKKVHYVNNQRFFEEIVKYRKKLQEARDSGLEDPRIPDYIGECIWKIAEKLSTKPCFINYSYRDEMISDGIENCILYFKDYDPVKGQNPFAYFTQVIYYAFLRRIYKEERNRYTVYKNFQETLVSVSDMSLFTDSDDNHLIPTKMYDNINEFMEKFERKERERKIKRKITKEGLNKFYEEKTDEGRITQHSISGAEPN